MTSSAILVGVGGVLGAVTRHLVGAQIETANADTFAVNVLGSVTLGLLVTLPLDAQLAFVFATGFCGAFTTFSSFAFETVRLYESGRRRRALANAVGSLGAALLGVALGAGVGALLLHLA